MKPNLKALWVATLRSGNYAQGRAYLRDQDNNCCCLGVLCDLTNPSGWKSQNMYHPWRHNSKSDFPTDTLRQDWGLTEDQAKQLALMNDNGSSFSEIAAYIEKNV